MAPTDVESNILIYLNTIEYRKKYFLELKCHIIIWRNTIDTITHLLRLRLLNLKMLNGQTTVNVT